MSENESVVVAAEPEKVESEEHKEEEPKIVEKVEKLGEALHYAAPWCTKCRSKQVCEFISMHEGKNAKSKRLSGKCLKCNKLTSTFINIVDAQKFNQ